MRAHLSQMAQVVQMEHREAMGKITGHIIIPVPLPAVELAVVAVVVPLVLEAGFIAIAETC